MESAGILRLMRATKGIFMKVNYDGRSDTLRVIFRDDVAISESDEDKPGVILDYDDAGNLVALEILDASTRVTEAGRVDFQTTS